VVTVLMSVEYLKQALAQLEKFGNDAVIIEVWGETRPVKLSTYDETGKLCLYIMPKAMPRAPEPPTEPAGLADMDDLAPERLDTQGADDGDFPF
jgi:hypothetical protein